MDLHPGLSMPGICSGFHRCFKGISWLTDGCVWYDFGALFSMDTVLFFLISAWWCGWSSYLIAKAFDFYTLFINLALEFVNCFSWLAIRWLYFCEMQIVQISEYFFNCVIVVGNRLLISANYVEEFSPSMTIYSLTSSRSADDLL